MSHKYVKSVPVDAISQIKFIYTDGKVAMKASKNIPKIYSDWLKVKKDIVPKFPLHDQCLGMQLQTTFSLFDLIACATAN